MFALCGNRTRDLLHSRRVFPSLPHIGRQYVFKTTTKLPLGILMQIFLMGRVIQEEGLYEHITRAKPGQVASYIRLKI
jgi:hypothetical protein